MGPAGRQGGGFRLVVDALYGGVTDADKGVAVPFRFDSKIIEKALRNIRSRKIDTRRQIDPGLFSEVNRIMQQAAGAGYQDPDGETSFKRQIRSNTEVFAAFKAHRMGRDMASRLLDDNGQVKTFREFRKDTEDIVDHHVNAWLRTEYDTAVKRAHRAAEMRQFTDEADVFPNIEWLPSTAVHRREAHIPFYHHIWPVNDPFWDAHKPGDEWGCQCSWRSTDEPVTDNRGLEDPDAAPVSPGLGGNPAKTGQLFSDDHPYFPSNCARCGFYKPGIRDRLKYLFTAREKDCYNCPFVRNCINNLSGNDKILRGKALFDSLKKDPDYRDVEFDEKTGAVKATSVKHNVHKASHGAQTFFGDERITTTGLEKECQSEVFRMGHSCIMEGEGPTKPHGSTTETSLDTTTDMKRMDIKSITEPVNHYRNALLAKNKQIRDFNDLSPDVRADSVILYFHDPSMYSEQKVTLGYEKALKFKDSKTGLPLDLQIKHIYCVVKGAEDWIVFDFE